MADVLPFAGTRFNTKEMENLDLSKIIAPPYDTITNETRKELYERHDHNMVRIVGGSDNPGDDEFNNKYIRAAENYREWKLQNTLIDEQRKCFYVHEHEYTPPGSKKKVIRRGFFALVKLQDFRSGKIRAHETTFPEPKNDRLRLLKATQVNLEPLVCLYEDKEKEVAEILQQAMTKSKPQEVIETEDGEVHRIWMVHRKDPILSINQAMKPKRLYIADGHHRYEAALQYRDEMREVTGRRDGRQPYDFILMYLNHFEDETINIGAYHRVLARDVGLDVDLEEVVEDLEEYFDLKEFKVDLKDEKKAKTAINKALNPGKTKATKMVMTLPNGRSWELKLKKNIDFHEMIDHEFMSEFVKQQDVTILHRFVIAQGWIGNPEIEMDAEDIFYCREIERAIHLLRRRKGCVAFFMNPLSQEDVFSVAENGELLPVNSKDYNPKIQSGFVLRDLQVGFG